MPRSRLPLILALIVAIGIVNVVHVGEGKVAVRESYGGAAVALGPGFHLRVPLYQHLYRYDTRPMAIDEPLEIISKDDARFKVPIAISAWISPSDLLTFHRSRAGREPAAYVEEQVRQAVLRGVKTMNADEILTMDTVRRLEPIVSADLINRGIATDSLTVGHPGPQVVFNAVIDYLRRKFPAAARTLAERSLAGDSTQSLFHAAMGEVLEAEGRTAEAEKSYLDALYLDPASPEPMSRLFVIELASNQPEKIKRLERLLVASLEKRENSPIHHDWLGQVYLRMGQNDKAEMAFNTAVGQAPNEAQFRISLGSLKAREGKLDEARSAYEAALTLKPDHPLALFNLGSTCAMQGQIDKALEYFQRAERVGGAPNHTLYNALAQAYEDKGQFERAAEALRRSLQIKPNQPDRQAELRRVEQKIRPRRSGA